MDTPFGYPFISVPKPGAHRIPSEKNCGPDGSVHWTRHSLDTGGTAMGCVVEAVGPNQRVDGVDGGRGGGRGKGGQGLTAAVWHHQRPAPCLSHDLFRGSLRAGAEEHRRVPTAAAPPLWCPPSPPCRRRQRLHTPSCPRPSHREATPLYDILSGCCSFTGPWTVTRTSLRMLRRVAAFCRPLRPVLLLVSFPRLRSPVVGVLGLCWMWRDVPFARQRRPIVGVLGVVLVVAAPPPPTHTHMIAGGSGSGGGGGAGRL